MSRRNQDNLQIAIRHRVYQLSDELYKIPNQSDQELRIVMDSLWQTNFIYDQSITVTQMIALLNDLVIDKTSQNIKMNIDGQIFAYQQFQQRNTGSIPPVVFVGAAGSKNLPLPGAQM